MQGKELLTWGGGGNVCGDEMGRWKTKGRGETPWSRRKGLSVKRSLIKVERMRN